MRRFDCDGALAICLEAKVHAVEVIGSHRYLAAPARDWKENQGRKTVKTGAVVLNGRRYSSFSRHRGEVKRTGGTVMPACSTGLSRDADRQEYLPRSAEFHPQPPLRHPVRRNGSVCLEENRKNRKCGKIKAKSDRRSRIPGDFGSSRLNSRENRLLEMRTRSRRRRSRG